MPEAQTPSRYSATTLPSDHMEKALRAASIRMPARSRTSFNIAKLRRTAASSTTKLGEGTRFRSKCAKAPGSPAFVSIAYPFRRPVQARGDQAHLRSEEHTSELQSLMRISSAVFCLK